MYCEKCGAYNDDNALYCESCGNQLTDSGTQVYLTDEKKEQIKEKTKQGAKKAVDIVKGIDTDGVKNKINETYAANKKIIIPVAAFLAVLLIGAVALGVMGGQNTPQKVAEKFFKAYADGKYGTMYSYFFDYQSDYINKDTVVAYLNKQTNNAGGAISKFKVKSAYSLADEAINKFKDKSAYSFADELYKSESESSLSFSQSMQVTYLPSGDSRERTLLLEVVSLKDTGPKAFRKYKVTLGEGIAENVKVFAGRGTTVAIDGIKLENPIKYSEMTDIEFNKDMEERQDYFDVYELGRIFADEHKIEISGGGFEAKEIKKSLYDSSICDLFSDNLDRELTKEAKTAIDKKSDAVIKAFYYGAVNDKNFSSLGIEDPLGNNDDAYAKIVDNFKDYTSIKINEVTLSDSYVKGSEVSQKFTVRYTYTYNSSYSDETYTRDGYSYITLNYLYSDQSKSFELTKVNN